MTGNDAIRAAIEGAKPTLGTPPLAPPDDPALDLMLSREPCDDAANARRFAARHGRDLFHVTDAGWFAWIGTHWDRESGDLEARRRAEDTGRKIACEAAAAYAHGPDTDLGESKERHKARCVELLGFSSISCNLGRMRAMVEHAETLLGQRRADLDSDPFLFNVRNGTLELHAEKDGGVALREHRREDLITKLAPVDHDAEADPSEFRKWLEGVQESKDSQVFLQRWAGYCLSGDTGAQAIALFHGMGANGKSTLVNVWRGIMGPYCQTLPVATLLEDQRTTGDQATPSLARLPGARLVLASEPPKGRKLNTAIIKQLTGGEPFAARELRKGFFEFTPELKLILSFNELPPVPSQDDGTWRRILLVPWQVQIPPEKRVPRYEEILLEEASAILNWMLDGFRLWREHGLMVPAEIKGATAEYRSATDAVGEFLAVATTRLPQASTSARDLFHAYVHWCRSNAVTELSQNGFAREVTARNIKRVRDIDGRRYDGILLRETAKASGPAPNVPPPGPEDF